MEIRCTEDTYWADVFHRLCLADTGVELDHFLEDPYQYLRRIGVKDLEPLALVICKGTA